MSTDQPPPALWRTPGRTLFVKYFVTLLIAVVAPLLLSAASEAWFGYRGQRASLNELLQVEFSLGHRTYPDFHRWYS